MGYWIRLDPEDIASDMQFVCDYKCNRCSKCCEKTLCYQTGCKCSPSERCRCYGFPRVNWPDRLNKDPDMRDLMEFAIHTKFVSGSWICIMKNKEEFDKALKGLKEKVRGTDFKVMGSPGDKTHVILMCNEDFADFSEVKLGLAMLKEEVNHCQLHNPIYYYKPSLFTSLGIKRDTIQGLNPYIYTDKTVRKLEKADFWRKHYNA